MKKTQACRSLGSYGSRNFDTRYLKCLCACCVKLPECGISSNEGSLAGGQQLERIAMVDSTCLMIERYDMIVTD